MKVLCASDSPTWQLLLKRSVEALGHEPLVAADGEEAWAAIQSDEDIGACITDRQMPGMSGDELIAMIRSGLDSRYVYTVLLTAQDAAEDVIAGMEAGADDYLIKPLDQVALATRLIAATRVTGLHRTIAEQQAEIGRLYGKLKDAFRRFVPESVAEQIITRSDEGVRLGGVSRTATVMFSDLRGFTQFSEHQEPEKVIDVVNRYLGEMSEAILAEEGTIVAYMGDGIMAVFGAPLEQEDHADRALRAARAMLDVHLPRFSEWMNEQGLGEKFRMGIGLNSGGVISGNVGSEKRLEYTALGDTTNTAARLEGMTKGTPHQLYCSETTREMMITPPDDLVFVDEVDIRGRDQPLGVWSLGQS
ncbi:MAG: adenylate/guanylate cyclase domain-containing protein [Solirubrobacterales bacterium]